MHSSKKKTDPSYRTIVPPRIGCGKSTGNTMVIHNSPEGSSLYYRYSFHPYDDTRLFVRRIGSDGESVIVNDEKYCVVNTKSGQAKQVFENLPGGRSCLTIKHIPVLIRIIL